MSDDDLPPDDRPAHRRHAPALLERLLDPGLSAQQRGDVVEALAPLEDPRIVGTLQDVALDLDRPPAVRAAALAVLECIPRDDPHPERIHAWTGSRDMLTQIFGLSHCGAVDGPQILSCLGSSVPGVRTAALRAMVSNARTKALVEGAVAALADPAAPVREMACRVAYFDEPYPMLRGVIRLLDDRDEHVRRAALDALADFPSVAALLAVAGPRDDGGDRAAWAGALSTLIARIATAPHGIDAPGRRRIENWLRPVTWLLEGELDSEPDDDVPSDLPVVRPTRAGSESRAPVDLRRAAAALTDPDTHPELLRHWLLESDWSATGEAGADVVRTLVDSDAWLLRFGVVTPLTDLRLVDALERVAHDVEPVIARRALSGLARCDSDAGLDAARRLLADERARCVVGEEALSYLLRFGPDDECEDAIVDALSRPDDRDGLFTGAARVAAARGLRSAVPALLALVNAPVVAWVRPHAESLRALRDLGHPAAWIDLSHLEDLDHLEIQVELAHWGHTGGRFG